MRESNVFSLVYAGRAPHGARGLKSDRQKKEHVYLTSRPTRGAWIEITPAKKTTEKPKVAPHTGRVD